MKILTLILFLLIIISKPSFAFSTTDKLFKDTTEFKQHLSEGNVEACEIYFSGMDYNKNILQGSISVLFNNSNPMTLFDLLFYTNSDGTPKFLPMREVRFELNDYISYDLISIDHSFNESAFRSIGDYKNFLIQGVALLNKQKPIFKIFVGLGEREKDKVFEFNSLTNNTLGKFLDCIFAIQNNK